MALSQADLDRLDAAIASSKLEVRIDGLSVRYRSTDELLTARQHVAQQLAAAAAASAGGRRATRRYTFTTFRGD